METIVQVCERCWRLHSGYDPIRIGDATYRPIAHRKTATGVCALCGSAAVGLFTCEKEAS